MLIKIKNYMVHFQIIVILILSLSFAQAAYGVERETNDVLVIYSHHVNFEWVEQIQKGLSDALEDEDLYLYNEYLNEHQLADDITFEEIFISMYEKYKNIDLDCIVVADNYAFNFMAEYYEKLALNTPIVFVAVNGYSEDMAFTDMMTGIPQNSDIHSMINMIQKINKEDELIFVSSQNATSIAEISFARKIIEKDYPDLKYRVIAGKTLDAALEELQGVENAQLIMTGNIINAEGVTLEPTELLSKVFETTHLPIYTENRLQINGGKSGAVGGVVIDPYIHAYEAGSMVKRILNGIDVKTIPVMMEPLTSNVFNRNMLEYFNIDESLLPAKSIILGKNDNSVTVSAETAISIGVTTFLLVAILIALLLKSRELKQEVIQHTKSQKKLQDSNNKFRAYIEMSPLGIFIANHEGRFIEVNKKACELSGYTEEELLYLSIRDYLVAEESANDNSVLSQIMNKGFVEGEYKVRKQGGQEKWVGLVGSKISDNRIIVFCTDISERKERENRIEYLRFHDSTTRVNNRAFFEEAIARLDTEEYLPLSYIISDNNGLKLINDALGHAAGDIVLIETANILSKHIRKEDVLARIGGDEFAILLPNTSNIEVHQIMDHVRDDFQKSNVDLYREKLKLSVSFGCATKTLASEPFSHIAKLAEDSMYTRKLLKRDSYHSSILNSLEKSLYERSQETEEHAERLVKLSSILGEAMGLEESELNKLHLFALMHDIGKISIDNSILTKPGKLTEDEWLEMKKHPGIGYRIAMTSSELTPIAEYILCHHERWDGKGYPQGLLRESIPLLSRILAIADAYDAMTSDRPYRKAMSKELAIAEIAKNSGTQFDPEIVKLFLELLGSEGEPFEQ